MRRNDTSLAVKSRCAAGLVALAPALWGCSSSSNPARTSEPVDAASSSDGPGPARTCSGKSGSAGEKTITVVEPGAPDGGARGTIVHVPSSYDPTAPTMLVLNFHGLLEPNTLQETVSHMSDTSDRRGFIVAYPQGLSGAIGLSWNAGQCCANTADDVKFVRDVVAKLEDEYCIDDKRVFATGLSNGGMFSYRLGCEAADVFAAVAPVAGAVLVDPCTPSRPVPVLAIHGTGDTIVPFNGGVDGLYHLLSFPPVSYSIGVFRSMDGCPGAPAPDDSSKGAMPDESTPDGGPNPDLFDGAKTVFQKGDAACHAWSGCKAGSEVELCTVINGGHAWPGGLPLVGKTSKDIDASEVIIDFFEKHPMP